MQQKKLPQGIWPVMLTPFDQDDQIDWQAYEQLVSFYLSQGSDGLFATCGSSEIRQLTDDQIIELVRKTITLTAGRVPVVASAIRFTDRSHQIEFAKRVADQGVDAVVFSSNQFGGPNEPEAHLESAMMQMVDALPQTPLGIYEYPNPYKRLVSPSLLGRLAQTGRFAFFKDTCCDLQQLKQKIDAVKGTPLRIYNAYAVSLGDSIDAGCDGFCGTGTNFIFEPFRWLCSSERTDPQLRKEIDKFWPLFLDVVRRAYPMSAKMFLKHRGIDIQAFCRDWDREMAPPTYEQLDQVMQAYEQLSAKLYPDSATLSCS
ncbi:MAG: dihydrodipicolinate synthase family protein [Phycisphaeraceae bacterium JB051]